MRKSLGAIAWELPGLDARSHRAAPLPSCPQGTYEELLTGEKRVVTTDTLGEFGVPKPQLALYRFSSALEGSLCVDAITGATVRFPMSLYLPSTVSATITPVSLLTVPVANDPTVTSLYHGKVTDGRAPHYLWTHAYKLFGYDANSLAVRAWGVGRGRAAEGGRHDAGKGWGKEACTVARRSTGICPFANTFPLSAPWPSLRQVDFLTYIGDALTLGQPISAALSGTNSQAMAVFNSALELLEPLLGSRASIDDIAASVVDTAYINANATWAANGDGSAAFSTSSVLSSLYAQGYSAAMPASRRRAMRRLHASTRSVDELKPLFDAVARVRGAEECG